MTPHSVTVIGHRGAGEDGVSDRRPALRENSIASFSEAFALGADAVETDLALTRDGRIALLHDSELVSSERKRRVADMDWSEIRSARPESALAEEAMEAFPGRRFVLELKRHTDVAAILEKLRKTSLVAHPADFRFISFEWEALRSARRAFPGIPCAWIATSREGRFDPLIRERHIRQCVAEGIAEISGHWRLIFPGTAERALRAGLDVGLGPINGPAALSRCLKLGANRLYTDNLDFVLIGVRA